MNKHLNQSVSAAFDCNVRNQKIQFKGQTYDLTKVSVADVTKLVADGCDVFTAKDAASKEAAKPAKTDEKKS